MLTSLFVYTSVALVFLTFSLFLSDPPPMVLFFVPVVILLALNLAIEPNSSALAMEPMGEQAGLASSLYGTAFFFVGAFLGSIITYFMAKGVFALVISFFLVGLIGLLLALGDRRK